MKLKLVIAFFLVSGIAFTQETKTYRVETQAWMVKDQKRIDIPIGYNTTIGEYSCWTEESFNSFKYGAGIYCKSKKNNDVFLTQAICDKRSPGDEAASNLMIIGIETVTLNVECRTTNREVLK